MTPMQVVSGLAYIVALIGMLGFAQFFFLATIAYGFNVDLTWAWISFSRPMLEAGLICLPIGLPLYMVLDEMEQGERKP